MHAEIFNNFKKNNRNRIYHFLYLLIIILVCQNCIICNNEESDIIINSEINISNSYFITEIDEIDNMISMIKEKIKNGAYDETIKNIIDNGIDSFESLYNITFQITTTKNQHNIKYNTTSILDLGECENILKAKNKINVSLPLIIFKIDFTFPDLLIPIVEYEIYNPLDKSELNLSSCNKTINLRLPFLINENRTFIYDPNSDYYTNECAPYTTEKGTDFLIKDRKKQYIENKLSLCEDNCEYIEYRINDSQISCNCKIKNKFYSFSELINKTNLLSNDFDLSEIDLGFLNILSCTKILFSINNLKTNISFYIIAFSIFFFIVSIFIFIFCGYKNLLSYMNDILGIRFIFGDSKIKRKKFTRKKIKNKNNECNPPLKSRKNIKQINSGINNEIHTLNFMEENETNNKNNKRRYKYNPKNREFTSTMKSRILKEIKINDKFNDTEMNYFSYKQAILYDKRKFCKLYNSLLKAKHPILFGFWPNYDYNIRIIKICIFLLSLVIFYAINNFAFFYEKNISEIYEIEGKYDIIFYYPHILICFVISHIITIIIKLLFLSESNLIELKKLEMANNQNILVTKIKRKFKIKYSIFFIFSFLIFGLFYVFLIPFSSVYKNTQKFVIKNTLMSLAISMVYPFIINIFPCMLRITSLKSKVNDNESMFNLAKFLQYL